ncbi:MAG: hypothetical protein ABIC04_01650 [Nanoarchaeota archaeon]
MPEEELFFVNVDGSDELRRKLLESSRSIIEVLKNYERFKSANREKQKEIEDLKLKIRQISRLLLKLKSSLPILKLKSPVTEIKSEPKKTLAKMPKSELDKLEMELDEIESKLGTLS